MRKNLRVYGPWLLIAVVFLLQVFRVFHLVNAHTVNLVAGDDFDDRAPLFRQSFNWLETFRYQWGPRRLGIGLWLTELIQNLSHWNNRFFVFTMASLLSLCVPLALFIKWRLTKRLSYWDALMPLIVLNLHQWELLLFIPLNGIPMLCVFLLCTLILTYPPTRARQFLFWLSCFVLIHTAYGIVAMLPIGLYCLKEFFQDRARWRENLFWGIAHLASLAIFLWGYRSQAGLDCFQFPHPRPWEYLSFQALAQSFYFGFFKSTGLAVVVAVLICALSYLLGAWLLRAKISRPVQVLLFLLLFSLSFQINAAIGRVCLGVGNGKLSRYVTFHIPQILALLWTAEIFLRGKKQRLAQVALGALIVFSAVYMDRRERGILEKLSQQRLDFYHCFVEKLDVKSCSIHSDFLPYPNLDSPEFRLRWEYLREHRLGIYRDVNY